MNISFENVSDIYLTHEDINKYVKKIFKTENGVWKLVYKGFDRDILKDFEYIKNSDGTYSITGWKGTYNGESSTEMIVPEHENIIF